MSFQQPGPRQPPKPTSSYIIIIQPLIDCNLVHTSYIQQQVHYTYTISAHANQDINTLAKCSPSSSTTPLHIHTHPLPHQQYRPHLPTPCHASQIISMHAYTHPHTKQHSTAPTLHSPPQQLTPQNTSPPKKKPAALKKRPKQERDDMHTVHTHCRPYIF